MCFESILVYFATMLASGCIDNQYSKGKEKVVINIHFKDANLFVVGNTTYAYEASLTSNPNRSLGSLILTETRCHMRCFKDIAATGTGSVGAEAV